jgi:hypothetical protein
VHQGREEAPQLLFFYFLKILLEGGRNFPRGVRRFELMAR